MTTHNIGEKPGKGKYCCTKCNWSVVLDDADDRLPPCGISSRRVSSCRINRLSASRSIEGGICAGRIEMNGSLIRFLWLKTASTIKIMTTTMLNAAKASSW